MHPRRVKERDLIFAPVDDAKQRSSSSLGKGRDDCERLAERRVEQRRLAHVGASDQRHGTKMRHRGAKDRLAQTPRSPNRLYLGLLRRDRNRVRRPEPQAGNTAEVQPRGQSEVSNSSIQRWKRQFRASGWLLLALVLLVGPFNRAGLWDPFELRIAELSRRLAHQLFSAQVAFDAAESLKRVTLGQLGMGELPFTSAAVGFALFGPTDLAGRVSSLFWGFVCVISLWALLGKLSNRLAQVTGVLALVTIPCFVWQSRMLLGDAATMGSLSLATTGLLLAEREVNSIAKRLLWAVLGGVGLLLGLLCRGALIGVVVPTLAVGMSAISARRGEPRQVRAWLARHAVAVGCLVVGPVALGFSLNGLLGSRHGYSFLLGANLSGPYNGATFAIVVAGLMHSAFPWSALFPAALVSPAFEREPEKSGERQLASCLTLVVVLSMAAMGASAARAIALPFPAVAALAGLTGLVLARARSNPSSVRMIAVSALATAVIVYSDFENLPNRLLSMTGIVDATLSDSALAEHRTLIRLGLGGFTIFGSVAVLAETRASWRPFSRARWLALAERFRRQLSGHIGSGLVLVETALGTVALMCHAHDKGFVGIEAFDKMSTDSHLVVKLAWLLPPLILVVPASFWVAIDGSTWIAGRLRGVVGSPWLLGFDAGCGARRFAGSGAILALFIGALLGGACMTVALFSDLAEQLSPKSAYLDYRRIAAKGAQLGLLGLGEQSARYYLTNRPRPFSDVGAAAYFLVEGQAEPRFLAFGSETLAELNSAHRAHSGGKNLLLVSECNGRALLATSNSNARIRNRNPLVPSLPDELPPLRHSLQGQFGHAVSIVGWELRDEGGTPVDSLLRGHRYTLRLGFRVTDTPVSDHQIFVHLDGLRRRQTADHEPIGGDYPTGLWQAGDKLVDDHSFVIGSEMKAGLYQIFVGFFRGAQRWEATQGGVDDNRLRAGEISIR